MGCTGSKAVDGAASPSAAPRGEMPTDPSPQKNPAHPMSRSSSSASGAGGREPTKKKSKSIHEDYEFLDVLGKGGFGEVRRGKRKTDGKVVAIKTISKLQFKTQQDHDDMINEVTLMARLRGHPNVCEQLDWYEDKTGFFVVLEIASGGELMERVMQLKHFSEKVAAWYFRQMLLALQHCHSNLVVHRDLKPENFLLESSEPQAVLKLTDFGLSCAVSTEDALIMDACGSAYYIAPEIFRMKGYTRAVDVWALGVILYLLLSGTVPFGADAETENAVYTCIQKDALALSGKQWTRISPAAKELVHGLLEKDPAKRYTLDQALAHPWVTGEAAPDTPLDRELMSSIMSFTQANKFKRKAMELVASTLSAADVANLRAAFAKIDTDNSGSLTYQEVERALRESGLAANKDAVLTAVKNMDTNGDGKVSWNEFLAATAERQLINYQNNMWYAFQVYDSDGDGRITVEELRSALKGESPERIAQYIAEFDADGDGSIDYGEFLKMLLGNNVSIVAAS